MRDKDLLDNCRDSYFHWRFKNSLQVTELSRLIIIVELFPDKKKKQKRIITRTRWSKNPSFEALDNYGRYVTPGDGSIPIRCPARKPRFTIFLGKGDDISPRPWMEESSPIVNVKIKWARLSPSFSLHLANSCSNLWVIVPGTKERNRAESRRDLTDLPNLVPFFLSLRFFFFFFFFFLLLLLTLAIRPDTHTETINLQLWRRWQPYS